MSDIDWGKLLSIAGVLGIAWSIARFIFLPLIEKSVRKILKPELDTLAQVIRTATGCIDDVEDIGEVMRAIDEDVTALFAAVRANRDILLDLNNVLPYAAGTDRREIDRRHGPELPQVPERRIRPRRRET